MNAPVHPLGYRGTRIGSIETPSAVVSFTDYPAGLALPAHAHALPNLCAVIGGSFHETWGRHQDELKVGNVLSKPAGAEHQNAFGASGARCLNIDLRPAINTRLESIDVCLREPRVLRDPRPSLLSADIARELSQPDELTPLAVESNVLALVTAFWRQRGRARFHGQPTWLRSARDLVRDRFTEPLKIEEIARELGVSPDHLARQFREAFRCSIADYIRRCRVQCAVQSLPDLHTSLAEIALRCGFYDQSHFCRVFKRVTGMTPSAWRARL